MNTRLRILIVIIAVAAGAYLGAFITNRLIDSLSPDSDSMVVTPEPAAAEPPATGPAAAPASPAASNAAAVAAPAAVTPIQDGKTIDFSSGAPVVKDNASEQAAIADGLKDIDEALQGVTIQPPAKADSKPAN